MRAASASQASAGARLLFETAAKHDLHLALAAIPRNMVEPAAPVEDWDADTLVCLRACVMKPEHREWMPEILAHLDAAAREMNA